MSSRDQVLGEQGEPTKGDLRENSWGEFDVGVLQEWCRVKHMGHEVKHCLKLNHLTIYLTMKRDSYLKKSVDLAGARPGSMESALQERLQLSIPRPNLKVVQFLQVCFVRRPFLVLIIALLAVKPQVLLQSISSWIISKAEFVDSSFPSVMFHGIYGI